MSTFKNIILISFMLLFGQCFVAAPAAMGQENVRTGVVDVKFTDNFASAWNFSRKKADGSVRFGSSALDQISSNYRIDSVVRLFPLSGRFEARHQKYGLHQWFRMYYSSRAEIRTIVESFKQASEVQVAEPVYLLRNHGKTARRVSSESRTMYNDPGFGIQWHYFNELSGRQMNPGCDIWVQNAWTIEKGKPEVVVAIIDGGVDIEHEDLKDNLWINSGEIPGNEKDDDGNGYIDDYHGYNFVAKKSYIYPDDHGTHVAGIVAAVNNNGKGICGVAGGSGNNDGARIMTCEVFEEDAQADNVGNAFVYAADNGAVIAQNSWGYATTGVYQQSVLDGIDYFVANAGFDVNHQPNGPIQGGIVFFAAGNEGETGKWWPGCYENVFAVASTDADDHLSEFSNYGTWIDISAPGGYPGIYSTIIHDGYSTMEGTSMACPHVSGVAALIVSQNAHKMKRSEVINRLLNSTDPIDELNPGFEAKIGSGRLNAFRALLSDNNNQLLPNAITDLECKSSDPVSATIQFTAPGRGNSNVGSTVKYDIRVSTQPIKNDNFNQATVCEVRHPQPAGLSEVLKIDKLVPGKSYYLAIKSIDHLGNVSEMSNSIEFETPAAPYMDIASVFIDTLDRNGDHTGKFWFTNIGQEELNYTAQIDYGFFDQKDWIEITQGQIQQSIGGGEKSFIGFRYSSERLADGIHEAIIKLRSNDPYHNDIEIPMAVLVHGKSAIGSMNLTAINFGKVYTGQEVKKMLTLFNNENSVGYLQVSSTLSNDIPAGIMEKLPIFIAPGDSAMLTVAVKPSEAGMVESNFCLLTNNSEQNNMNMVLKLNAVLPPVIDMSIDALEVTLEKGENFSHDFSISNQGSDSLFTNFMVLMVNAGTFSGSNSELMQLGDMFTEDFEGNATPPGWDLSSEGIGWTFSEGLSSSDFKIPSHTRYAVVNDDYYGTSNNGRHDYLVTPELSLKFVDSAVLVFDSYFTAAFGMKASVEISFDGNSAWYPLVEMDASATWQTIRLDLTPYKGKMVRLAFHANDNGGHASGWAIDNVHVMTNINWVSVEKIEGEDAILAEKSNTYRMNISTQNIPHGEYQLNLWALCNDPATPSVALPINLSVIDAANSGLSAIFINNTALSGFKTDRYIYEVTTEEDASPVLSAKAINPASKVEIKQATNIHGSMEERKAVITVQSANGGTTSEYVVLFTPLVSVVEQQNDLRVYPNPFNEYLEVSYGGDSQAELHYELYNILGEKIAAGKLENNKIGVISTEHLHTGVYILSIYNHGEPFRQLKLMK